MAAQLLPNVVQQFRDSNGNPLVGGLLYSYQAGTTTPLATYTDETAVTPNTNPVVLDSSGQANVWLGSSAYKFVLKDSSGNVQWTVDNVSIINPASIDKTKVSSNLAGAGLAQNGGGSFDIQVDNVTLQIVGNLLQIKSGGISADTFNSSSKLEVLTKSVRDLTCPGIIQQIPQYEWSSPSLLTSPGIIPSNGANVAKWSPNGEFLAVGINGGTSTQGLYIYQRSGTTLTYIPLLSYPNRLVFDVAWSACGDFLAAVGSASPYIALWQRVGNQFNQLSTPSSVPGATVSNAAIAFSPDSDFLAFAFIAGVASNFILYERTGTDGKTFSDVTSSSGLTGINLPIAWKGDGTLFAALDISNGNIDVYRRSLASFSGITPPNVSGLSANSILGFSFSPDGKFFAVTSNASPYLALYSVSSLNAFTLISNPATLPAGIPSSVAWSANSEYLAIAHATTPFMTIYQISGTTFTKIANPGVLPAGSGTSAHWTQTKQFLSVTSGISPYIQVYQTASTLPSNALLWTRGVPNV